MAEGVRNTNLRPIAPGEVRNPAGKNGVTKVAELRAYLDERAEPTSRRTRRENLLASIYATALDRRRHDHIPAARLLLAYDLGKPREELEVSGPGGGPLISSNSWDSKTTAELRDELAQLLGLAKEANGDDESPTGSDQPS